MTTMKEYFKEVMQQSVQDFEEENQNHSLEKEAVINIYNIDNGNRFDISTDAVSGKIFSAYLCGILEEVPETKDNNDTKTTEIYLNHHQIQKIIKKYEEIIEEKPDKLMVKIVNAFKEIA